MAGPPPRTRAPCWPRSAPGRARALPLVGRGGRTLRRALRRAVGRGAGAPHLHQPAPRRREPARPPRRRQHLGEGDIDEPSRRDDLRHLREGLGPRPGDARARRPPRARPRLPPQAPRPRDARRRRDGERASHAPLRRAQRDPVARDARARLPAGEVRRSHARRRHPGALEPGGRGAGRAGGARGRHRGSPLRAPRLPARACRGGRVRGEPGSPCHGVDAPRAHDVGTERTRRLRGDDRDRDARGDVPFEQAWRARGGAAADVAGDGARGRRVDPGLRGCLAEPTGDPDRPHRRVIVRPLITPEVLAFVDSQRGRELALTPPLTSDHLIRTKALPLWIDRPGYDEPARLAEQVREAVRSYTADYRAYVERHAARLPAGLARFDALPRVVLMPGLGALCAGGDVRAASIARDITVHTLAVKAQVSATGVYEGLPEAELFDMEYHGFKHA